MSLNPASVNFTGTNKILQGTTWTRALNFGTDMTAYISGLTRGQFKTSDGATVHFATSNSTLSLVWGSGNTVLTVTIAPATSSAITGPISGGIYEIEAVSAGGAVERIATGTWDMDKEVCTAAT